jgi:hypothetical protein
MISAVSTAGKKGGIKKCKRFTETLMTFEGGLK